jgi:arylsulfatase A-like enzyme
VYIQDHRIVGLDPNDPVAVTFTTNKVGTEATGKENPGLLRMRPSHGHDMTIVNGISRIGYMSGAHAARWKDEDIADTLTKRAVSFIETNKDKPFFLYFATHDIHVPRVPHPRFAGATDMGPRGDVIVELDWCVGELMATLKKNRLDTNTLVIFSSDNGPVVDDGYRDEAVERLGGHKPAGPYRGGKYSVFEGGTRVPMIVRWPGRVKPGTSDALVCHVDLLASLAALTGQSLQAEAGPDSFNILPALLGDTKTGRDDLVEHAGSLALRKGKWKLIEPGKGARFLKNTSTETGNAPMPQLYAADDMGERNNVAAEHADVVEEMTAQLKQIRAAGRSRP